MNAKEIIKQFRSASWTTQEDLEVFILSLSQLTLGARVLAAMLEVLCSKRYSSNERVHRMRCAAYHRLAEKVDDRELFLPYIKALKGGDQRVRALMSKLIPTVNNPREHIHLANLLRSQDEEARMVAVRVLKQVGGKTVLDLLTEMVKEPTFLGRSEAMDVVMPIAGHHAIPVLEEVIVTGSNRERIKALNYLGSEHYMLKSVENALEAIRPCLKEDNDHVRAQAVRSYGVLCDEETFQEELFPFLDSDSINVIRAAIAGLRRFSSPPIIAALDRKLRAGPNVVRMEVLDALEAMASDEVLPPLVEAIGSRFPEVRNRARDVLNALSKQDLLEMPRVVVWLLRSRDVNVRRMAVDLARQVKDPAGTLWPKVMELLRDEDWWVRERVVDALVDLAGEQITPHMVEFLADKNDVVRRFAVGVLQQLGDPRALGALVRCATDDTDWWTREKAIEAVALLRDERAVPYVVNIMRQEPELRLACLDALLKMGARDSVKYIAPLLESEDPDIRLASLRFMERMECTEFNDQVIALRQDPNAKVAHKAQEMAMRWGTLIQDGGTATGSAAISVLDRMLMQVDAASGDDMILAPDQRPYMKQMGKVAPISSVALTGEQVGSLLQPILSMAQMESLRNKTDVDLSYDMPHQRLRWRVNIFNQKGGLGAVFRNIRTKLPDLQKLGLPKVVQGFGDLNYGLVLVGGPTGSGKSTTLAALIDYINRNHKRHVISLEDPIEVVHHSKQGLVNQREIGTHTHSFNLALRSTLRQDPDVILVGEMRDLDTISFAVAAADSGHLVFGTVHTASADTSIDRLINAFPPEEQDQARFSLAENLRAVLCQYLVKRADGEGRVAACEVMLNNDAVANLIRKGKTYQIPSVVATGRDVGMQSMDGELMRMHKEGIITLEEAFMKATSKKEFEEVMEGKKEKIGSGKAGRIAPDAEAGPAPPPADPDKPKINYGRPKRVGG